MNFDLNIHNYSVADLEKFLKLYDGAYNEDILKKRVEEWLQKVGDEDATFRDAFRLFLQEACRVLTRERLGGGRAASTPTPNPTPKKEPEGWQNKPLVYKRDTPFVYAENSQYFGGVMNPLDKHLVTRVICINSLFRDDILKGKTVYPCPPVVGKAYNDGYETYDEYYKAHGIHMAKEGMKQECPYQTTTITYSPVTSSASDFIFRFPEPLKNVASIELMSIELPPYTWFDVTSKNGSNTFVIEFAHLSPAADISNGSYVVTIPDGNYTAVQMQATLTEALQGICSFVICNIDESSLWTSFRLDETSALYNVSSPQYSPLLQFSLRFSEAVDEDEKLYEKLGWKLGFRASGYWGGWNLPVASEARYRDTMEQYLFLEVDDFNRNNQTDAVMAYVGRRSYVGNNILARISVSELSLQGVTKLFKKREYFGSVRLEKLRLRLLDCFGRVLDMNQADYSLALEVKQIYS